MTWLFVCSETLRGRWLRDETVERHIFGESCEGREGCPSGLEAATKGGPPLLVPTCYLIPGRGRTWAILARALGSPPRRKGAKKDGRTKDNIAPPGVIHPANPEDNIRA